MTLGELVTKFKNNHTYVKRFEIYDKEGKTIDEDIKLNDSFMDIFSSANVIHYNTRDIGTINRYDSVWSLVQSVQVYSVQVQLDCYFVNADRNW